MAGVLAAMICLGLGLISPRRLRPRRPRLPRIRIPRPRRASRRDIDLGVLASEVATRLTSGAGLDRAWELALARTGLPSVAPVLNEEGCPRVLVELDRRRTLFTALRDTVLGAPRLSHLTAVALPSLLTATRLTWRTGAPMAHVLDECADGLTEAGEAQAARQIALAGPKSTAALLAWLPLLGVLLGVMVGADPVGFFLGRPLGRLILLLGLAFEAAGLAWVRHLVHRAEIEGAIGARR